MGCCDHGPPADSLRVTVASSFSLDRVIMDNNVLKLVPHEDLEQLLTEEEVIAILGFRGKRNPKRSISYLIAKGKLRCVNLGRGNRRFRSADVKEFIEKHISRVAS